MDYFDCQTVAHKAHLSPAELRQVEDTVRRDFLHNQGSLNCMFWEPAAFFAMAP
jgi:hypothetical protein